MTVTSPRYVAGRAVAADEDVEPESLVLVGGDAKRQAAASRGRVLGHELHGRPAERMLRGGRRIGMKDPRRARRVRHRQVVLREDLDGTIAIVGGIDRGRLVGDDIASLPPRPPVARFAR